MKKTIIMAMMFCVALYFLPTMSFSQDASAQTPTTTEEAAIKELVEEDIVGEKGVYYAIKYG